MKRFFKYLGRTILSILGLLLLIVFLLYLPPVQDFLLRKAERYAASHYDLEVRIGHFRLGFPFDLVLDEPHCHVLSAFFLQSTYRLLQFIVPCANGEDLQILFVCSLFQPQLPAAYLLEL